MIGARGQLLCFGQNSGRQFQPITPEDQGGDNTNYPSPPNEHFFEDPEVPFGPQGPQPPAPPEHHEPPGSSNVPPGWPPTPPPAGGRERVGTGNKLRERLPPRPSPPEPQLIPVPMSDEGVRFFLANLEPNKKSCASVHVRAQHKGNYSHLGRYRDTKNTPT